MRSDGFCFILIFLPDPECTVVQIRALQEEEEGNDEGKEKSKVKMVEKKRKKAENCTNKKRMKEKEVELQFPYYVILHFLSLKSIRSSKMGFLLRSVKDKFRTHKLISESDVEM